MAKVPGPALALAAVAAILLMSRKKDDESGPAGVDSLPDGTVVPDTSDASNPAAPKGGGKKVPKGTGAGGGSWDPGAIGPKTFWVSPNCLNVIEGDKYYDDVLVPAIIKAQEDLVSIQSAPSWTGSKTKADVYTLLAFGFGMTESWGALPGEPLTWSKNERMEKSPLVCILPWPPFHIAETYGGMKTTADSTKFNDALEEFSDRYPQLFMKLYSLQERLLAEKRLPVETFGVFDLGFNVKVSTAGGATPPPEAAPVLKVSELSDTTPIKDWYQRHVAYAQKWSGQQHARNVNALKKFSSAWWTGITKSGTVAPVPSGTSPEKVVNDALTGGFSSPATHGVLVGRLMNPIPGGPISGATVRSATDQATSDSNGFFEIALPVGMNALEIFSGPGKWDTNVEISAGQSHSKDLIRPG